MRKNNRAPAPFTDSSSESFEMVDLGEPVYKKKMPPARSVIQVVPPEMTANAESSGLVDLGEPVYKMEMPPARTVIQVSRHRPPAESPDPSPVKDAPTEEM